MPRLWGRIIRQHKMIKQSIAPCRWGEEISCLEELCHDFDIPRPIWLGKHQREFSEFRQTSFLPEHFMEEVDFDKLEIEFLEDVDVKRRSKDPRNQFDGF